MSNTHTHPFVRWITAHGLAVAAAVTIGSPAGTAAAAAPAQSSPGACLADGQPVIPVVDAARTYGWAFIANFDHAPSATSVTTCLVERSWAGSQPGPVQFTVSTGHCTVTNNVASPPAQFGNGVAQFDGNISLSCAVPVPATAPVVFWTRARVIAEPSRAYALLSSGEATFSAQTKANCALRLTSTYALLDPTNIAQYSHDGTTACGASILLGTRITAQSAHASEGAHRLDAAFLGSQSVSGHLELPANYAFSIGAPGQTFVMDWLVIDPTPQRGVG